MKKTFKFFAAALAIVAAASCAKEISNDNIQNENPTEETVRMTFSASFDSEGETKTVLAENNFVHWTDEDAIRIFYKDKYGDWNVNDEMFSIEQQSNDANPTFAIFTGNTKPSTSYYAASPYAGWTTPSGTAFQFDGLATQNAVKGGFDPARHIAMSVTTSGDVFEFQNACALLKVTVGSDNVYSVKVEGQYDEVGIGKPIRFTPSSINISRMYDSYSYPSDITLKNANSSALENGATYYIVVPHVTVKNFKVSLCDANGKTLVSKSKASDFKIERNKIYDLGTFEVPAKVPAKVGDYFYSDGTYSTELDKSGTVVGVVFYVGNPTEDDTTLKKDFPNCVNGLVVGLSQSSGSEIFGENNVSWESTDFMSTIGVEYKSGSIIPREPGASLKTGYNNTAAFRAKDSGAFALSYCNNMPTVSIASTWFIPTVAEFDAMYESLAVINNSIEAANGAKLSGFYSTTSQEYMYPTYIGKYNINEKRLGEQTKRQSGVVRPIFAF